MNTLDGFWQNQYDQEIASWDRIRWQTTILVNMQLPKAKQIKSTDLLVLPGEKVVSKEYTVDKRREIQEFVRQRDLKIDG